MRIDSALFCNVIRILSLLLTFLLFGCQSASHDVRQIGREALTEAYIQLDSSNKTEAMRLFKEAEHYGLLADDTLTVAHARYNIALNLGYHADKEQTVSLLKAAVKGFGDDYVYCAKALMTLGDFYQFHRKIDSAEIYMNQALTYATLSNSSEEKGNVLSAFYSMYFNAGEYEKAAYYLRQTMQAYSSDTNDNLLMYYYHGMGNIFYENEELDSAFYYYRKLEELVTQSEYQEDKWFYYTALANFAKKCGDYETAYKYMFQYEKGSIHNDRIRRENNLELVTPKYNDMMIQNKLSEKIIHKQRIIIFISAIASLFLAALSISLIRLSRQRKREAEINAQLFHFKQQNNTLTYINTRHEQIRQDYADRLSDALTKEQRVMLLLDIYLKNNKKANLLNELETFVYDGKDHWNAMLTIVEQMYPDMLTTLQQKHPDLDEDERKSYILSFFKLSRQEEADYLGTTVNMVDKLRGKRRKKMEKD